MDEKGLAKRHQWLATEWKNCLSPKFLPNPSRISVISLKIPFFAELSTINMITDGNLLSFVRK